MVNDCVRYDFLLSWSTCFSVKIVRVFVCLYFFLRWMRSISMNVNSCANGLLDLDDCTVVLVSFFGSPTKLMLFVCGARIFWASVEVSLTSFLVGVLASGEIFCCQFSCSCIACIFGVNGECICGKTMFLPIVIGNSASIGCKSVELFSCCSIFTGYMHNTSKSSLSLAVSSPNNCLNRFFNAAFSFALHWREGPCWEFTGMNKNTTICLVFCC